MSWQPGIPPPQSTQSVPVAPFPSHHQNPPQQWQQTQQQVANPKPGHLWQQGNSGNPGWSADMQRHQATIGQTAAKQPHQQSTTSNSAYQSHGMSSQPFQAAEAFENPGEAWSDWDWNENQQQSLPKTNYLQSMNQAPPPPVQSPNNNLAQPAMNRFTSAPPPPVQDVNRGSPFAPPQFGMNQFNPAPLPQQNSINQAFFHQQHNQNVIEDSFSTDQNSWNWSMDANASQKSSPQPLGHSRNASIGVDLIENQQQPPENNLSSIPDDVRNTQANIPNPLLTRVLRNDHQLTPQWSTESQMSHSSSDRSGESENMDSRSSNTTSEDAHHTPFSPRREYNHHIIGNSEPDKLDVTLAALNETKKEIKQPVVTAIPERKSHSPQIQPLAPPPPAVAPTPSPPSTMISTPLPPPIAFSAPPMALPRSANSNPFKRSGMPVHKTLQFQTAPRATISPDNFSLPPSVAPEMTNQENLVPDNAEIVPATSNQFTPIRPPASEVENHEIAPNNDRNQFLETGHLAEEHLNVVEETTNSPPSEAVDSLPPPGLSRYVLGEPEISTNSRMDLPEPPPGLDRMVPGTDLANASNLNMERQADGQVSNLLSTSNRRMVQQVPDNPTTANLPERNLYLASGESEMQPQSQRVVTGDESGRHTFTPIVQPRDHDHSDQPRELEVDGENLQDQPQRIDRLRDEPIEGANTGDDDAQPSNAGGNNATEVESVATIDTGRKDASNISTCDDSDKDRSAYYKSSNRRDDRRKNKERYDSEDSEYTSDHGRRRFREGSNRDDRYERDRDKYGRYRDDGRDGRYSSRDEYNRRRDDRDENDSRRDEKGRRYKREYDRDRRDDRRKDERYRNRDEKDRDRRRDRRYDYDDDYARRDREGDRDRGGRDDRRKDDRYREEKDRDRRRGDRKYDYDEGYHRSGSRNTDRERVREKDPRYPSGYYQSGYGYDSYSYYSQQQMQYYEALRRTNPQAYAEWYRKYYAQMQPQIAVSDIPTDGRESVHSGRSSANEKERYSRSMQYYQPHDYQRSFSQSNNSTVMDGSYLGGNSSSFQQQQQPSSLPYQQPQSFFVPNSGRQFYSQSDYSESRYDNNAYSLEKTSEAEVARLTPKKFTNEHVSASLSSAGLMVCIKPRFTSSGVSNLVKIINLGVNDAARKLFQSYPGPLVRGTTHKKTVIEFCEDQIRLGPPSDNIRSRGNSMSSLCSQQTANRASFTLLWNLLILLLRQNGMVVGTDISELLMKNKIEFPCELDQMPASGKGASGRNSQQSDVKKSRSNSDGDAEDSVEEQEDHQVTEERQALSEIEVTDKFRNYLLYGNVNEALDWAAENNLWGHALFLASKVDRRSHANVMMKFANKLPLSDPLQTLYQLMSLRTPSSVTSAMDEKWGDWRPHLAMIISNTSQKPELNIKAITTLGDSLYNRGDIFGAHFCYLMAQVNFGKYRNVNQDSSNMSNSSTSPRLILLGSSPHRSFRQFATSEAIMMTEIYEYACTLNDDKFSVTEFQPYKYILASRMLDYGMQLKSLLYMEQISKHIQKDPSKYEEDFIERVFVMADRLKYYDPMHDKSLDDTSPDGQEGAAEGQNWLQDLQSVLKQFNSGVISYHSSSVPNLTQDPQAAEGYPGVDYSKSEIDEQFREINQQFNQLNLQYQAEHASQPVSMDYGAPSSIPDYQPQQANDPYHNAYMYEKSAMENPVTSMDSPNYYDPAQFGSDGQQNVDSGAPLSFDYYGQTQSNNEPLPPPSSQTPSMQVEGKRSGEEVPEITELQESPKKRLEKQPVEDMPKPQITMPNSFSNKPGFYADTQQENDKRINQGEQMSQQGEHGGKKAPKEAKALGQQNHQQSSWFGGIFGKFSLKPKNQMILPDDKNPTIVWDPDKKKWVNTDGEETEAENFKPPPKMSDFMTQPKLNYSAPNPDPHQTQIPQQPQITHQPPLPAAPTPAPAADPVSAPKGNNLQSNMFKMQRNRTLKNSYVDVFNPSGAPMKPAQAVLAPTLPSVPQAGFFVPPAGSGAPVSSEQSESTPQFYNPNQFGNYQ
ncbi:hypothetical protein DMENIID0001_102270 [Sergentomyia squamirostris]